MSAKSVAVKLLSRREHSVYEIRHKLAQRGFDESDIAQAITELQQGGWLSDERYAEAYVRMRQNKGYGPVRIAMELKERGVNDGVVERYLQADNEIWQQILKQQHLKKYGDKPVADYNDKSRRIRFLQYRGFPLEMIYQVINDRYKDN